MLNWHYVTRAAYDAADSTVKSADKLYFLSDTHEIYRGTENFTESVILYSEEPTIKAVGKLYVNSNTLEGRIWNGTAWTTVIQPVQAAIVSGDTSKPVSSKAVEDYVGTEIKKVTGSGDLIAGLAYTEATNKFTVTKADKTTEEIELTGVAADLIYDKTTGLLQVKNASGTTIGTGINLDLERFVSEASYDAKEHMIVLKFNDSSDPLKINVGDLVDTYTAKSTSTVKLTVTGNEFAAEAIVAATEGNMLQSTKDGLFVAATNIDGKMDKDADAVAGNVAKFDADGNAVDAGYTLGGAALAAAPAATVLATEKAVDAIRTALQTSIDGKMTKVATGKAGEVLVANADGDASLSGAKVGGAVLAAAPDAATLATEKAVETYVTGYAVAKTSVVANGTMATTVTAASDDKVPSEKALVDAMTWKTTV